MAKERKDIAEMIDQYLSGKNVSSVDDELVPEAYERFLEKASLAKKVSGGSNLLHWAMAVAACAVLVAGIVLSLLQSTIVPEDGITLIAESCPVEAALPDGSVVRLGPDSRLVYSEYFGTKDRNLTLEGEAFIEAAHDENLPMVVSTPSSSVRVLGTRFSLREYPEDEFAVVILHEGSVSFCDRETVVPGESAYLDRKTGDIAVCRWTDGVLAFGDVSLSVICSELSRRYGVKVVLSSPPLSRLRFSAEFNTREQTLEDVLQTLSLTRKIRYRILKDGVEIF